MSAPNGNNCGSCKWFERRTPVQGSCMLNPPTAFIHFLPPRIHGGDPIRIESSMFPIVQVIAYCSHHEGKDFRLAARAQAFEDQNSPTQSALSEETSCASPEPKEGNR